MFDPHDVQDPVGVRLIELGQTQPVISPGEGEEHVGGERHLILIKGIQHENRHVEEHNGGLVPEHGRGGLVIGLVSWVRHDVLKSEDWVVLLQADTARYQDKKEPLGLHPRPQSGGSCYSYTTIAITIKL